MHNKEQKEYPPFSVAMCVYGGDNSEWFDVAMYSVIDQTVKPDEIVLVVDGPITSKIHEVIEKYEVLCKTGGILFKIVELKINQGLGNALRIAVNQCRNEWIARMDSDDICHKERFEKELSVISQDISIDVIGGDIAEFEYDENNIVGVRSVPTDDAMIKKYLKKRCPFNHMSVMYKKSAILIAGNYIDWYFNEDYYLWIRMMKCGCVFANTGTVLVSVRSSSEQYNRRGGIKYFKSEIKLQNYMRQERIITPIIYTMNVLKRIIVQILLSNKARGWVYRVFARK